MERVEPLPALTSATDILTRGTAASRPAVSERTRLAALALAGVCAFLDLYAPQPLLPMLRTLFHTSAGQIGWTISATTLAVAISAPFAGLASDRFGRRPVILASLLGLAIPSMLAGAVSTLPALLFWRFVAGLFMPGIIASALAYIAEEWTGRGAARAVTTYVTGTVLGGFIGRMLTGVLAEHGGWRLALSTLGALTLIGAIGVARWLPASKGHVRDVDTAGLSCFRDHLRNPVLIATYAVGFSVLFSLVATFTYITFHLAAAPYRLGPIGQGALFFVYLLGLVVTPAAGPWIHRLGQRRMLSIAVLTASAGVLLTLAGPLWIVVIGLAICSSGVFICQAAASSFVGTAATTARSAAAGLYVAFYYVGGSAGAVVPGELWNRFGWPGCVALIVAIQVLAGTIAWRYWRLEPTPNPSLKARETVELTLCRETPESPQSIG